MSNRDKLDTLTSLGWLTAAAFFLGAIAVGKESRWWALVPAVIVLIEARRIYRDAYPSPLPTVEGEDNV